MTQLLRLFLIAGLIALMPLSLLAVNDNKASNSSITTQQLGEMPLAFTKNIGQWPVTVATGDFDNDFDIDLVVVNDNSDNISVLLNLGSEQTPPQVISVSPSQNALNVPVDANITVTFDIDMNETTFNDLTFVVSSRYLGILSGTYSYDAPTKTITFDPTDDFKVGEIVRCVLTTGIRSSGGTPLEFSKVLSFTVETLFGDMRFTKVNYSGRADYGIVSVDLNGDGLIDQAGVLWNHDSVVISINSDINPGTYEAVNKYHVVGNPKAIAAGDFDSDDDIDLAVVSGSEVLIMENDGTANFTLYSLSMPGVTRSICAGDFDGDGCTDLAVGIQHDMGIAILYNQCDSSVNSFEVAYDGPIGGSPNDILAVDIDNDMDLDLVIAFDVGYQNSIGFFTTYINKGDGVRDDPFDFGSTNEAGYGMLYIDAADLNNDGYIDIVIPNPGNGYGGESAIVFLNIGASNPGNYPHGGTPYLTDTIVGSRAWNLTIADFDNDHDLDMAVLNGTGNLGLLTNNGSGVFVLDTIFTVGGGYAIDVGDYDNDGDMDLVTTPNSIRVFLQGCFDSDGDGFGDPDHPENACPDDNCPDIYNPDQLDTNDDGIGDACQPQHTLNVTSSPISGVLITMSPENCSGGTTTPFSCDYADGSEVTLTAPATDGTIVFLKWKKNGADWGSSTTSPILTMDEDHSVEAIYIATHTLSVSSSPTIGVSITMSPDNCSGGTTTPFSCDYVDGSEVTLTAPSMAGSDTFVKWTKDGVDWVFSTISPMLTMDADYSVTAVYEYVLPHVIAQSPTPNELGVDRATLVTATFNTDMNPTTIHANSFVVIGNTVGFISGVITYDNGSRVATFTPDDQFPAGENLTVVLTTIIESITGLPLNLPYSWAFVTAIGSTNGYFSLGVNVPTGVTSTDLELADLNGDKYIDIVHVGPGGDISVVLSDGAGWFEPYVLYEIVEGQTIVDAALGDFDGDNDIDVAVLRTTSSLYMSYITILANDGSGFFVVQPSFSIPGVGRGEISSADFNADGKVDLAFGRQTYVTTPTPRSWGNFAVLIGNGDATFSSSGYVVHDWTDISGIWSGDLDGDGFSDIVAGNRSIGISAIYYNDGLGSFDWDSDLATEHIVQITFADFDGDSDIDVRAYDIGSHGFFGGHLSKFLFFENIGGRQFVENTIVEFSSWAGNSTIGDIDGDGDIDLLYTIGGPSYYAGHFDILRNDGNCNYPISQDYWTAPGTSTIAVADYDNDGDMDIFTGYAYSGNVTITINSNCFDTDGDTYGDPGYDNTCPEDNCPNVYNPGQELSACITEGATLAGANSVTNLGIVDITFDNVTVEGTTEMIIGGSEIEMDLENYQVAPSYFSSPSASVSYTPIYYNISTTATYVGNITVCINYDDTLLTPEQEDYLRLLHHNGTEWIDITSSIDTDLNMICGLTSTLSPFAIAVKGPSICCGEFTGGFTGNANCDTEGLRNLADITRLIDNIYISKEELCCPANGNANGDELGLINLADITKLIDHVYISKEETAVCE